MKKGWFVVTAIAVAFFAGLAVHHYFWPKRSAQVKHAQKRKPLYWVAPMDPNYRRDKPGKSPMGMDLVPVYAKQKSASQKNIAIPPAMVHTLGVRTAVVTQRTLPRLISTVGYVTANEDQIEHIHLYTSGWIRKLYVSKTGEPVEKGQLLAEIYSPALVNAQEEYLLAVKNNNQSLMRAGHKKLLTLGVTAKQIAQIKRTLQVARLIKLFARQSGVVAELKVREGMFVKPELNVMTIEELSPIWVIAHVYARQAKWVGLAQPATAQSASYPGRTWRGEVNYVYPSLAPKTQTLRVRLVFSNHDLALKPRMFVDVRINAKPLRNVLVIPKEALIRTAKGAHVIQVLGQGKYRPKEVVPGAESGEWIVIHSGLKVGEKVVTSSQFLLDSEANLKMDLSRHQTTQAKP